MHYKLFGANCAVLFVGAVNKVNKVKRVVKVVGFENFSVEQLIFAANVSGNSGKICKMSN